MSSGEPPKFIKDAQGVRRKNPQWSLFKKQQQGGAPSADQPSNFIRPTMANEATALPVITNKEDVERHLGPGARVSDTVAATEEMLCDDDIAEEVGLGANQTMQHLSVVFAKYEVPLGLSNKLLALSEFSVLLFLIDDSGSMNLEGALRHPNGTKMTRWQEVYTRIGQMIEIFACVPIPPIIVRFLNRPQVLELKKNDGENPMNFHRRAMSILTPVFQQPPAGTTPMKERLQEVFHVYAQVPVSYYLFCDGQPNGGAMASRTITQMLINRPNPTQSPVNFLTVTNNPDDVEWCREAEEAALFCGEISDYEQEMREVLGDQGAGLPFSYGLYLICSCCGAFCPNDLDALDESAPMTKSTLDNILGYQTSIQEYQYYFDQMCLQQSRKEVETALDKLKKDYIPFWKREFNGFVQAPFSKDLPVVQAYQNAVTEMKKRGL